MPSKIKKLVAVFLLGLVIRFWDLSGTPAGLYVDEAHLGYTAYSLLRTGRDSYGKSWPVMTKLFGSYSAALYSYMTVLPVSIFGLNTFSTRILSAVSGSLLVLLSGVGFGPMSALVVAVSPVFVFFSRAAFEANLALTLLGTSWLLYSRSRFNLAVLFLSLSAYAYHAEKLLAPVIFLYFLRRLRLNKKKILIPGLIFVITQLPLWLLSLHPAVNGRLSELALSGSPPVVVSTFVKNYLGYLSPDNLFSRPDPDIQRSFPEVSVFYWWMFIPLIIGIFSRPRTRIFLFVILAIIPGAITRDYFSTIRVLPVFLGLAIIISRGLAQIVSGRPGLLAILLLISLFELYSNLVLLKYERSGVWGYQYRQLAEFIAARPAETFLIDTSRQKPLYILLAFYNRWPPAQLQSRYSPDWLNNYYDQGQFSLRQEYGKLSFRPIDWTRDASASGYLVGDLLSVSDDQAREHQLAPVTRFTDLTGNPVLGIWYHE